MKFSEQVKLAKSTKHIHSTWYRETYPEVAELGLDPAAHYLRYGAEMGRNPGENFNTQFYLDTYPEVRKSKLNPLVHYALHGQKAGYATRPQREDPRKQINVIRTKLLSLGFTERPLAELTEIANTSDNPEARAMAARELALWHMRAKTETDYRTALDWIAHARPDAPDLDFRSKLSTVELLCYHHLNDQAKGLAAYDRAALAGEATPDLTLARVNYEQTPKNRVLWINQVLAQYGIEPVTLLPDEGQPAYDRLTCAVNLPKVTDGPKVTVLIAAYDAAEMLPTALRSLQEQTWQNLEIIVLDDCSPTPDTVRVAEAFAARDPRIQVVKMEQNGGAYVARNHGLDLAKGEFVTLHDADDWSHPRKIEKQVRFMMEHPEVMGCTSEQARTFEQIIFGVMRAKGELISSNTSSLMLRKTLMTDTLGAWDGVRFGADGELLKRLRDIYGKDSIKHLSTGPMSFQRSSHASVTSHEYFGYEGTKFGTRRAYEEIYKVLHRRTQIKKLEPKSTSSFYAPLPMRIGPKSAILPQHYDVIIASDFRFPGGTSSSNAEEIKAQKQAGLKTGIVELFCYTLNTTRELNEKVVELLEENSAELITYGQNVTCDTLIIRQPLVLDPITDHMPSIKAKDIRVIINQPPKRDYADGSENIYNLARCAEAIVERFGRLGIWHPIGPLVRTALVEHHAHELKHINLSDEDWPNIIDSAAWARPHRPDYHDRPIRVCRHSRDGYVKWPNDPEIMRQVYPDAPDMEIHVLGGAKIPTEVLGGRLPKNWKVLDFGSVHPKDFLAEQDVFVYFTHPDWVEAFGRAIFEPMCVGVPVILPNGLGYEKLFGEAALYRDANEVEATIRMLVDDPTSYNEQVQKAFCVVQERFSFETHYSRLRFNGEGA